MTPAPHIRNAARAPIDRQRQSQPHVITGDTHTYTRTHVPRRCKSLEATITAHMTSSASMQDTC